VVTPAHTEEYGMCHLPGQLKGVDYANPRAVKETRTAPAITRQANVRPSWENPLAAGLVVVGALAFVVAVRRYV
jgi:hypothetical protein